MAHQYSATGLYLVATMVGDPDRGDRHVRLVSTGGDILLTVPEALGMRFDIKGPTHATAAEL